MAKGDASASPLPSLRYIEAAADLRALRAVRRFAVLRTALRAGLRAVLRFAVLRADLRTVLRALRALRALAGFFAAFLTFLAIFVSSSLLVLYVGLDGSCLTLRVRFSH